MSTNIVPIQIDNCQLSRTGATFPENLELSDWLKIGERLNVVQSSYQFLIGDWINFGSAKYGDKYSMALECTEYEKQTLYNCAAVCKAVEISRRRENLTFGHHEAVAGENTATQDWWLARASENKWSVSDLRQAIRQANATHAEDNDGRPTKSFLGHLSEALRLFNQKVNKAPIDTWADAERRNTKEMLRPWVEFYERL